ncbi:butyrophilin subfamily 1 member A1-like [Limanda limanda]|uniref:butyrophilin subfamily 1 member A1-like n=1 Tax=Limanda limanda TaxID=27771 RepID=UPI0029C82CED|nr:butyrophilin subfamily 1 member A1-like [Limanda limanda]
MWLRKVSFLLLLCLSAVQQETTVKPGDDATLQCHSNISDAAFMQLQWTRLGQKSDRYVFFYRNNRSYDNKHLQSFRGRVELRDPEMKDGDVSVILKNVTVNDAGTYKCHIISSKTENGERTVFSSNVSLTVTDSGPSDLHMMPAGKKEEGDNGGVNEDGGKIKNPVVYAACGTFAVMLLIGAVFISCTLMNKQTCVQTEKTEKDAELHVKQTNHMSQRVDQQIY